MNEILLVYFVKIFNLLRETNPKFAEKLSCVAYDLEAEDLGLSASSRTLLQNEVDIFVHSAANMKFRESFRYDNPVHDILY